LAKLVDRRSQWRLAAAEEFAADLFTKLDLEKQTRCARFDNFRTWINSDITADSARLASPLHVMAGLVPAIHVFLCRRAPESKTWMPATSAGMTMES
jgi:hypothetical protein